MQSLVIFASGRGSNAAAIHEYFQPAGKVRISAVVANNPQAGVIPWAESRGIPVIVIDRARMASDAFAAEIAALQPDLIVLAGFLWKIPEPFVRRFEGKIVNIHPALLPGYGGKGMYGAKVHEAVVGAGEKESGITIHRVNEAYDEGAILLQARCAIAPGDDAEALAEKIHRLEHFYFPRTLEFLLAGN